VSLIKGGVGSASRVVGASLEGYTVSVLGLGTREKGSPGVTVDVRMLVDDHITPSTTRSSRPPKRPF
jgi:L-aminopeptidase/D-esterase-like protein